MNDQSSRPELVADFPDMGSYDVLLLGFPIWWYTCPAVIRTFLESVDTAYLAGLSPDVLPALRRLQASEPTPELASLIAALESHAGSDWTEWSLSNVRYG